MLLKGVISAVRLLLQVVSLHRERSRLQLSPICVSPTTLVGTPEALFIGQFRFTNMLRSLSLVPLRVLPVRVAPPPRWNPLSLVSPRFPCIGLLPPMQTRVIILAALKCKLVTVLVAIPLPSISLRLKAVCPRIPMAILPSLSGRMAVIFLLDLPFPLVLE